MDVQACPSCGSRYNVARLEPGVTFDCRKCGASVEVGAKAPEDRRTAPGLVVAGVLLFLSPFLYANPWFGARFSVWPWQKLSASDDPRVTFTYVIWGITGVWTIFAAFRVARGVRSAVTVALAAALLVICAGPYAGLSILPDRNLPWMLAAVCLATGLRLLGDPRYRGTARALAFTGGLVILLSHSVHFEMQPPGPRIAQIQILWEDLVASFRGEDVIGPSSKYSVFVYRSYWMIFGVCALGIFSGLGGLRRLEDNVQRWFGIIVLGLLTFALLYPTAYKLGHDLQSGVPFAEFMKILPARASQALVDDGLALLILGTFALLDLVRARRAAL